MYIFKRNVKITAKPIFIKNSLFICLSGNNFDIEREVTNNTIKLGDANNIVYMFLYRKYSLKLVLIPKLSAIILSK